MDRAIDERRAGRHLVLIPTELERSRLRPGTGLVGPGTEIELAGFGPVAAAAVTAELLAALAPDRVFLVGIAGTFDPTRYPVGSALAFSSVAIDGVGAGEGRGFRGPSALGLPQCAVPDEGGPTPVHDELPLVLPAGHPTAHLLTVAATADGPAMAEARRARHPTAVAEDMEGFAVALACARARVPLTVVRGISNVVGERDPAAWRMIPALDAARELLGAALARNAWSSAR